MHKVISLLNKRYYFTQALIVLSLKAITYIPPIQSYSRESSSHDRSFKCIKHHITYVSFVIRPSFFMCLT